MAPTCSRAAIRFVATILLVSSVANAVALPHQVLDPRTPLAPRENVVVPDVADAKDEPPKNFWEAIGKLLNNNSGWDIFRDFWARLFGARPEDNDNGDNGGGEEEETITTTVYVTPTPAPESSTPGIILPPPVTLPLPVGTETIVFGEPSETSASESEGIFSILPWGDVSTAIAEYSSPVEITIAPVEPTETSAPELSSEELGPAPAVPITDQFSVTIPIELLTTAVAIPEAANSTAPVGTAGTGLPLPWSGNVTEVVLEPTLVTAQIPIETPAPSNETALNTTSIVEAITSIVVVTATVTPGVPLVTEVASASVGLPIAVSESPIWVNSTAAVVPVAPAIPLGTGTAVVPIIPIIPIGTGSGIPIIPIIPLVTGTGSPAGTGVPVPEVPLFPNTTSAVEEPVAPTEVSLPITVTGTPGETLNLTVSIPSAPFPNVTEPAAPSVGTGLPIAISEAPIYTNTSSEAAALPTPTALPGTGSALPSAGSELPVPTELPTYTNSTAEVVIVVTPLPVPIPVGTGVPIIVSAGVSVGINLPAPISEGAPLFPNTTAVAVETPSAVVVAPPAETSSDAALEFPGVLNITIPLPTKGY